MAVGNSPYDILKAFEQKFIDALEASLDKYDKSTPGTLRQSIKASTKILGQRIELQISMNDYWKFVDKGVNGWETGVGSEYNFKKSGKPIPLDSIKKFIAARGITLKKPNLKTRKTLQSIKGKGKLSKKLKKAVNTSQYDSMAFAIGKSIKKKGIKPTHFASEVMEGNLIKEMSKEINLAVGREIKLTLANVV